MANASMWCSSILMSIRDGLLDITTRPPAVTDVFGSGRNVGALRPARRVGFRSMAPGIADGICRGHIIFVIPTVPKLSKLGPNSKQGKLSIDHSAFFKCI